jgi:hypothetical protein
LVGPPSDWGWTDFVLLLSADPRRLPTSGLDSYLLLQGGMAEFNKGDGDEGSLHFLAALLTQTATTPTLSVGDPDDHGSDLGD